MKLLFFASMFIIALNNSKATESNQFGRNEGSENTDDSVDIFTKCYEDLGCIHTDSKWYHKTYRPINLRPLERHIIKTDFLLLKRSEQDPESLLYNSLTAKYDSIEAAGFNNGSELMIVIHDFTANGYTGWVKHVANIIFEQSLDYNLISVDWQRGAEPPYDQAIANARVVALEIINLLKELKEEMHYGFNNIHMVGHGVGAHIAGYVGATYDKMKKITGLDPSSLRFQGMPDTVKLNPTCAQYVEIIHTDALDARSQGINETLGHSDFYVNGAKQQPGCPENKTFPDLVSVERNSLHEGEILPGCDHKRSFKYFIESISNENCTFMGIRCENDIAFENGGCTSCNNTDTDCRTFGLKTYRGNTQNTKYFLNTADHAPFCMFQYRISIFVKESSGSGYFDFILVDENANVAQAILSSSTAGSNYKEIKGDQNNTFVYYAHRPKLGVVKEAKVRWNQKKKFYCIIYCKTTMKVDKIFIENLSSRTDDERNGVSLCSPRGVIEDGTYETFTDCSATTTTTTVEKPSSCIHPTTGRMSKKTTHKPKRKKKQHSGI